MTANREVKTGKEREKAPNKARHISLPGFLIEEEIGLGDVIKRTTYAVGIPACAGCQKRP